MKLDVWKEKVPAISGYLGNKRILYIQLSSIINHVATLKYCAMKNKNKKKTWLQDYGMFRTCNISL